MLKQIGVFLLWCFYHILLICALFSFYRVLAKILPGPDVEGFWLFIDIAATIGFFVILGNVNLNYKTKFHKAFYKASLEWFYMDYYTLINHFFEVYKEEYEMRRLKLDKEYDQEIDSMDEVYLGISKEELKRTNNLKPFNKLFCQKKIKDYLNGIDVKLGLFEDKFIDMLSDDIRKYHEDHFNELMR